MIDTKFKVGDKVIIVNYGSLVYSATPLIGTSFKLYATKEELYLYDITPEYIDLTGIIVTAIKTEGKDKYAIKGKGIKHAWYDNGQLKLC